MPKKIISRYSEAIPAEIPEKNLGGFPAGILRGISGSLRGALTVSSTGMSERLIEEILGGDI